MARVFAATTAAIECSIAEWTNEMVRDGLHARVPHPFPDPEVKTRPRHLYCAAAVLSQMCASALVNCTELCMRPCRAMNCVLSELVRYVVYLRVGRLIGILHAPARVYVVM